MLGRGRRLQRQLPLTDDVHEDSPHSSNQSTHSNSQRNAARQMLRLHQTGPEDLHTPSPAASTRSYNESPYGSNSSEDDRMRDNSNMVNTLAIMNVVNEIDKEKHCDATETMVKKCIKQQIWSTTKFVTDITIKSMNCQDRSNPNTLLNILLTFTRKNNLSDVHRFRFWKKYGSMVQKELNVLKTITTRSIRSAMLVGKLKKCIVLFLLFELNDNLTLMIVVSRIKNGT